MPFLIIYKIIYSFYKVNKLKTYNWYDWLINKNGLPIHLFTANIQFSLNFLILKGILLMLVELFVKFKYLATFRYLSKDIYLVS